MTGALWDTENGPGDYDEVNLVAPGTNSGWRPIMGPDARDPSGPGNLFDMPGAGSTYSDPEFSWLSTIAPTGIAFPRNSSLGPAYENTALVGDANFGQVYAFPLDGSRTGFDVSGVPGLADLVADSSAERDALRFGQGFGLVSDLKMGPDGHLYVVSLTLGSIFRIQGPAQIPALPPWAALVLVAMLGTGIALYTRARGDVGRRA